MDHEQIARIRKQELWRAALTPALIREPLAGEDPREVLVQESPDAAEACEPVETPAGRIYFRDAIFLDTVELDYSGPRRLVLRGEIAGDHCEPPIPRCFIAYTLEFDRLLGMQMVELDFSERGGRCSFVEVKGSAWLARMRERDSAGKVTPEHRHYRVAVYDDVIEVVSAGYTMTLGERVPVEQRTIVIE